MSEKFRASLIRAYCDGELSQEEAGAFETRLRDDAELQAAVAFERALRQRVEHLQRTDAGMPDGLAERIRASWAAELNPAEPVRSARRSTEPEAATRSSWLDGLLALLAGPRQVSALAVTGVLLVVSAVVLYGIFGTPIDDLSPNGNGDLATEIVLFVAGEHERCTTNQEALKDKVNVQSQPEAVLDISEHLNVARATIFDLSAVGFTFVGEGRCMLPGTSRSAHLVYRRDVPGQPTAYASVFVAPNSGRFGRAESDKGECTWSEVQCEKQCNKAVFRTVDDELVYFLVCCDPSDREAVAGEISKSLARKRP